jgi:DNA invertase Pin-like site-specific DNA recombinase
MKAFLYARVSTKDKGQETENQLAELRKFASHQQWEIVHEYIDHETGSSDERAQLKSMMLAASQRRADVVVFWALDRLTREGALPTLQYLNTLTSYGVAFKSFTEQYLDSCGIFKDAVISILATIAKQERQRMSERVRAGMARARENGARFGRPRMQLDIAQIGTLHAHGWSLRRIAAKLEVSEGSIRNALKSNGNPA